MWHAWKKQHICIKFWFKNLRGGDLLGDKGVGRKKNDLDA